MAVAAINPYLVGRLFPKSKPIKNINDMINEGIINSPATALINDTLKFIHELESIAIAIKTGVAVEQGDSGLDYTKYITPHNPVVCSLAGKITNHSDSNDQKMFKIEQWVQEHIEYKTDIQNYGQLERWAYPVETLNKKSGDCEDQAFLIHSLGLAAGVPPNKLRTYGGLVFNPGGTAPGGHGWTAYMRESDYKWITMDSSYYPLSTALSERKPMSEDLKYIDDFWYIQAGKTIATPYANKIRYASDLKGVNIDVMA
jgi:hypothetical protein